MVTHLLLNNNRKRFSSNKKAFSSIIGAILAAIIIISLFSALFMWSFNQNSRYNNAVTLKNQLVSDQQSEKLLVLFPPKYDNVTISATNGMIRFSNVTVENRGTIDLQIIRIMVKNLFVPTNIGSKNISLTLKSGQIMLIDPTEIPINYTAGDTFASWLVTARGNIVSTIPISIGQEGPTGPKGPQGPPALNAMTAQGIGSVAMDFNSFKYYRVNSSAWPSKLLSYPAGQMGYASPCGNNIYGAFAVNITNYDMYQRNLTFTNMTMMWVLFPVLGTQPRSSWWYVVNIDASGNILRNFTPIPLAFNQTKTVVFASVNPMVNTWSFAGVEVPAGFAGPAVANLMIVGTAGTDPLGNNIPFVSIIFS